MMLDWEMEDWADWQVWNRDRWYGTGTQCIADTRDRWYGIETHDTLTLASFQVHHLYWLYHDYDSLHYK